MNRWLPSLMLCNLLFFSANSFGASLATPVWIDSDPACDGKSSHDVDDCWALVRAVQATELRVEGVSTVFGNSSERNSYNMVAGLLAKLVDTDSMPPVYRGARSAFVEWSTIENESVTALAAALQEESLTIIALGPLTNIAMLIERYPEVIEKIDSLVVVAGQRPEQGARFHPGPSQLFHVHDFNFRKDVAAFQRVLDAGLPVTLLPYEAARQVQITEQDLMNMQSADAQSELLAGLALPWLAYWQSTFRSQSFYPFDSLAVGYVIDASRFSCNRLSAHIERRPSLFLTSRDRLLVSEAGISGARVNYCSGVDPRFKNELLHGLAVGHD